MKHTQVEPPHKVAQGFSLIEMTIVVALGSFLVMAGMTLIQSLTKVQLQAEGLAQVMAVTRSIEKCLNTRASLGQTLSRNIPTQCFFQGQTCLPLANAIVTGGDAAKPRIQIFDAQGLPCSDIDTITPTAGFNWSGQSCNGFNAATGNPDCPFRYEVTWAPECETNINCRKPVSVTRAQFMYRPGTGPGVAQRGTFNEDLYSVVSAVSRNTNRRLIGVGDITFDPTRGGGGCEPDWVRRKFTTLMYDSSLDSSAATAVLQPYPDGTIKAQPGSYRCEISSNAINVGRHQSRLMIEVPGVAPVFFYGSSSMSSAMAPPIGPAFTHTSSNLVAFFQLNQVAVLEVQHSCQQIFTVAPAFSLGIPYLGISLALPGGGPIVAGLEIANLTNQWGWMECEHTW